MNNYLNDLSRLLVNQLSPEEYNNVMQYYTEYFADAGIEKQEEVIKELGTPEELAAKIIAEYKGRQEEENIMQDTVYAEPQQIVQPEVNVEPEQNHFEQANPQPQPTPRRRLKPIWIVLIVIGGVLLGISILIGTLRKINVKLFKNLEKIGVVEQEYYEMDEFSDIDIDIDIANVEIVRGDEYAVEYRLGEDAVLENKSGILSIEDDSFKSIITGGITSAEDTYVKIYVPEDAEVGINLIVGIGDINIEEVTFDTIYIEADLGDVTISGESLGGDVEIIADLGNIDITGYLACDISIEADLGKVNITSYYYEDAYDCSIDNDLGEESIKDEGGEEIEGKYNIDVKADIGDVTILFCND